MRHNIIIRNPARPWLLAALLLAFLSQSQPTTACTAFFLSNGRAMLMAKNYDWHLGSGMLMINPSGLEKVALVSEGATPAVWTSRYTSLTFNQYGREFPMGGMNEAGLAMEVLWLENTRYPPPGERPQISALQWVQSCLDRFSTVDGVVRSAHELALASAARLHFLACDFGGECAVIEFLDGRPVIHIDSSLPIPVLTNDTYEASLAHLRCTADSDGGLEDAAGEGSMQRFTRAAIATTRSGGVAREEVSAVAFDILTDVAQIGTVDRTQWSIVYDLQKRSVSFRTADNEELRTVRLADLDLRCPATPMILDLTEPGTGDVTRTLRAYDTESNFEMIRTGFAGTAFLADPPQSVLRSRADYPAGLRCSNITTAR